MVTVLGDIPGYRSSSLYAAYAEMAWCAPFSADFLYGAYGLSKWSTGRVRAVRAF